MKENCTEFVELMQRQLDGELSELELKRLEKHIYQCPACAADYQTFQEMNDLFQGIEMVEPPVELQTMIMAEIMAEVESDPSPQTAETNRQASGQTQGLSSSPEVIQRRESKAAYAPPIGAIIAMVLAAGINGVFFLIRILPFFNAQYNSVEQRVVTRLFLQFFARFAVVGRHTGEALQKALQTVIIYLPWQLVITYLIVAGLSILGLIYFLQHGRKGGNLT